MSDQYPHDPQDPTQAYAGQGGQGQQPYGQQPPTSYQAAPTAMSPQDERTWGAISHAGAVVAMVCSAGFLGFLASIAVYVVHKDRGPFVRAHAANSINLQISMFIWLVVVTVLYVVLGVVTDKEAKLGNIAYEMTVFANRAGAALSPQLVLELKNSVGAASAR